MKNMFRHKLIAASALAFALFASYSCKDDDKFIFPEPADTELSTLEVMRKDPELANFLEVADRCGEGTLDSLLNQSRVYTIWAPVNEAVDKDYLIQCIEDGKREMVFQQFIKFHIANNRHAANGEIDKSNKLMMINEKYVTFCGNTVDGYTFGDSRVVESNILTKNGLIHKISNAVTYSPSIWEALANINSVSTFWQFCKSFTVKEIDKHNSIPGPIVNQMPTYLDTVYYETNEILNLNNLGPVDNEDSIYITYVPTSEVWDKLVADAPAFFRYNMEEFTDEQKQEADSIANVRGAKDYLRYLTYSMTEQEFADGVIDFDNLPDSLIAMHRDYPDRKKFASSMFNEIERVTMSNGEIRVLDYMPFTPYDLWYDTIKVEAENDGMVRKDADDVMVQSGLFETITLDEKERNEAYEDELSQDRFLLARPDGSTLPARTYFFRNVLSAKYKIAIVTVPENITSDDNIISGTVGDPTTIKSSALRVTVSQSGEQLYSNPQSPIVINRQQYYLNSIRPNPLAVDTIYFVDTETSEPYVFDFQYCEDFSGISTRQFEEEDYTVEVSIQTVRPAIRKIVGGRPQNAVDNVYAQNFQIDQILLIPVREEEETTNP